MPAPPAIPRRLNLSPACASRVQAAFTALDAARSEELRLDLAGVPAVPAELARWLLLEAMPSFDPLTIRLALWNATLTGRLTLAEAELKITPSFANCMMDTVDLTDGKLRGFELLGGRIDCLRADRVTVSGTMLVRGQRDDPIYHHATPTGLARNVHVARGILLCGASIRGNLDLRGAVVGPIAGEGRSIAVLADGVKVDGNLLASDGFSARGEVRFNGCAIGRTLYCDGAALANPGGNTLSIVGGEVKGDVKLGRAKDGPPLRSTGTVRLQRARVAGNLDASGGVFTVDGWDAPAPAGGGAVEAIAGDELKLGGSLHLSDRFEARGQVRFVSAQIGGDLNCADATFDFPGETAFIADGTGVAGIATFARAACSGVVRLELATIKQGLEFRDCVFDCDGTHRRRTADEPLAGDACGVQLRGAAVTGTFTWTGVIRWAAGRAVPPEIRGVRGRTMWLYARDAVVDGVEDDDASWEQTDRLDLDGARYDSIVRLAPSPQARLARLDREYAPWNAGAPDARVPWHLLGHWFGIKYDDQLAAQIERFSPGPYLQLAKAMRAAGFPTGSSQVLLRLERNRTRYGGYRFAGMTGRWVLDLTLRYGLKPFLPLWYLLMWWLGSGALLKWVHDSAKTGRFAATIVDADPTKHHAFHWAQYSLDTLLPFVSLGQKAAFAIHPEDSVFGWIPVFNAVLGYLALAFVAAGLGGLVRSGRDS